MADDIGVGITGDLKVALQFDKFPEALRAELLKPIKSLTNQLAAKIRAIVPKGKTGKLASEVVEQIFDDPDQVSGRVTFDAEFAKAGALEYGAHRSTKVRAHEAKLDHAWGKKLNEPLTVLVAAYSRTPSIAAHNMLRGPLAAMSEEVISELRQAIDTTITATE